MKKVFGTMVCAVFFLALIGVGGASAQALKIGVYDSARILKESKTVEGYNKELSKSIEAKRVPLAEKENALRQLVEKLRKDGPTLSAAERKALEDKATNDDKDLKRLREDIELDLRKVQAELRQKAFVDINAAVKAIGDKENFTIIFEKSAAGIAYLKDSVDITGKVLTQVK